MNSRSSFVNRKHRGGSAQSVSAWVVAGNLLVATGTNAQVTQWEESAGGTDTFTRPLINLSYESVGTLRIDFRGILEESMDLDSWIPRNPQPNSPYDFTPVGTSGFYRADNRDLLNHNDFQVQVRHEIENEDQPIVVLRLPSQDEFICFGSTKGIVAQKVSEPHSVSIVIHNSGFCWGRDNYTNVEMFNVTQGAFVDD